MFKLLRYFSIASAVSMAVATLVLAFLYRESAVADLVVLKQEQNVAIARMLAQESWSDIKPVLDGGPVGGEEAGRITRALARHAGGLPLLKVKVYDLDGVTVYSSRADEIGQFKGDNPALRAAAEKGETVSYLVFRDRFNAAEGVVENRDLVSSYVPAPGNGSVEGVFELYMDVSPLVGRINLRVTTLVGGLVAVFLALYGVLYLVVGRADRILATQYGELEEARDKLRVEVEERNFHVHKQMAEREVAEAVLGESGRRFRDFMESSTDWYWEMDENLRYAYLSERIEEHAGVKPDELLGLTRGEECSRHCSDRDLDDDAKWRAHFQDLEAHRPFRNLTVEWRRPDGDLRTFLIGGLPVFDAEDRFLGYRGTGTDITELRRKEEALHWSEEALVNSLKSLANAQRIAHLGNWEWDLESGKVTLSDEMARILGIGDIDFDGTFEGLMDRVHSEDASAVRAAIDGALMGGEVFTGEHRVVQPSGQVRRVRAEGEVAFRDSGEPIRVTGVLHDISELKEIEEALHESRERYALALQGANDGIWDWDLRDGRLYVSSRVREIFGLSADGDRMTPDSWRARVHPDDQEKFTSRFQDHLRGATDFYSCEYRIQRPDGSWSWVLDRAVALRDRLGRAYRVAGSVGDVNTRRLAEDRLRHSQKMEALGKLAGGIAHEFNNLLVGIGGFANMAVDKIDNPDRVRFCLDEVIKASDKAAGLTGDLLAFSRQRAAKPTLLHVQLADVVDDVSNLLRTLVRVDIELGFDIEDREACVEVDPSQLSQVVTNLAINARDAMPDGGRLTVGTRALGVDHPMVARNVANPVSGYGCIFVRDSGTGIDPETMKHLFEPFFTTKETGKGTGLGLAMVYGLIEQAGGFVDVTSELGHGSTFSVCLPLSDEAPTELGAARVEGPGTGGRIATILVAEDDEAVRMLAVQTLEDMGHSVLEAADGRAGLEVARSFDGTIDLLVTDLVMPEIGGRELARTLTDERDGLRVMVMTAYPDEEEGCESMPMVRKPFTPAGFGRAVQEFLDNGGES